MNNAMNNAINEALAQGWRIESSTPTQVVMVRGGSVNHVLHGILTLLFFGLWAIVWLILIATNKTQRRRIWTDGSGGVFVADM